MSTIRLVIVFVVVPHITDAIQEWVERVAKQSVSDDEVEPQVHTLQMT